MRRGGCLYKEKQTGSLYHVREKRGALLAKGRLLGVQFDALFTDELYFEISKYVLSMADRLKMIFHEAGLDFYLGRRQTNSLSLFRMSGCMRLKKRSDSVFGRNTTTTIR